MDAGSCRDFSMAIHFTMVGTGGAGEKNITGHGANKS